MNTRSTERDTIAQGRFKPRTAHLDLSGLHTPRPAPDASSGPEIPSRLPVSDPVADRESINRVGKRLFGDDFEVEAADPVALAIRIVEAERAQQTPQIHQLDEALSDALVDYPRTFAALADRLTESAA